MYSCLHREHGPIEEGPNTAQNRSHILLPLLWSLSLAWLTSLVESNWIWITFSWSKLDLLKIINQPPQPWHFAGHAGILGVLFKYPVTRCCLHVSSGPFGRAPKRRYDEDVTKRQKSDEKCHSLLRYQFNELLLVKQQYEEFLALVSFSKWQRPPQTSHFVSSSFGSNPQELQPDASLCLCAALGCHFAQEPGGLSKAGHHKGRTPDSRVEGFPCDHMQRWSEFGHGLLVSSVDVNDLPLSRPTTSNSVISVIPEPGTSNISVTLGTH